MTVSPSDMYHHRSLPGVVECDGCGSLWPCHLSAWGSPDRWTPCQVRGCTGRVFWTADDPEPVCKCGLVDGDDFR